MTVVVPFQERRWRDGSMTREVHKHKVWKTRYAATRLILNDLIRYKRFLAVFSGIGWAIL
jgi:hypothetical protein